MNADIVDACPECDSTDVYDTYGSERPRGRQRPRYHCMGCGTRFNNPARFDTVTKELV